MTMNDMKQHVATHADDQGNLWCNLEGCRGTPTVSTHGGYGRQLQNGKRATRWSANKLTSCDIKEVHDIEKKL